MRYYVLWKVAVRLQPQILQDADVALCVRVIASADAHLNFSHVCGSALDSAASQQFAQLEILMESLPNTSAPESSVWHARNEMAPCGCVSANMSG